MCRGRVVCIDLKGTSCLKICIGDELSRGPVVRGRIDVVSKKQNIFYSNPKKICSKVLLEVKSDNLTRVLRMVFYIMSSTFGQLYFY